MWVKSALKQMLRPQQVPSEDKTSFRFVASPVIKHSESRNKKMNVLIPHAGRNIPVYSIVHLIHVFLLHFFCGFFFLVFCFLFLQKKCKFLIQADKKYFCVRLISKYQLFL